MDPLELLKSRLDLAEVVRSYGPEFELIPRSPGHLQGKAHDSLSVYPEKGSWFWRSQSTPSGDRAGGDALAWIAFQRFGRTKVNAEDFQEVLREACALANLDYEELFTRSSQGRAEAERRRKRGATLDAFAALGAKLMDGNALVKARARKPWLSREIVNRWRIGHAPTLRQMREAGLNLHALLAVGLVRFKRGADQAKPSWESVYPFYRECFVIPITEHSRVRNIASRRYLDWDPVRNQEMKGPKAKFLPAECTPRPDGFNLDAIHSAEARDRGLLLVEAPLDAIACCERGHPAVGMLGSSPSEGLIKRLHRADCRALLALDGTADVTALKKARVGAQLGVHAMVCSLPPGRDPDDLTADELAQVKGEAWPVARAWVEMIDHEEDQVERAKMLREFAEIVRRWRDQSPELAAELRQQVGDALGMTDAEYARWLLSAGRTQAAPELPPDDGDSGPPPVPTLDLLPGDAPREPLANFQWVKRWRPNPKGLAQDAPSDPEVRKELAELKKLPPDVTLDPEQVLRRGELVEKYGAEVATARLAKPLGDLRDEILQRLSGWPQRLRARSAREPILFVDRGEPEAFLIAGPKPFKTLLQEYTQPQFLTGLDDDCCNCVGFEDLYTHWGWSEHVREWVALEEAPHEPPMDSHYYCWRPPTDYVPDGRRLAEFVSFFDNLRDAHARGTLAAAIVTPFWGGPYGKRPAFVFDALERGSGKTTVATLIGHLVSKGGPLSVNLDRRSEERLKERLLSPEGVTKRVCLVDNVKGSVAGELLEELITCAFVSGKKLHVGEASRPNTLTYYVTANNAQLSADMTSRSFYVHFMPLKAKGGDARAHWERDVKDFLSRHGEEVVADCLWVLRQQRRRHASGDRFDWKDHTGERFPLWVEDVLDAVLRCEPVAEVVGEVSALDILRANQWTREESDEDLEQAEEFMSGLLERVVEYRGKQACQVSVCNGKPIFLRTQPLRSRSSEEDDEISRRLNMVTVWQEVFTRREISAKWLVKTLRAHIDAGRINGLTYKKRASVRGWELDPRVLKSYLERTEAGALEEVEVGD